MSQEKLDYGRLSKFGCSLKISLAVTVLYNAGCFFSFGSFMAGAAILGPVLKLGKGMSDEEYVRRIVPCVVKLFASNDRNARYKLLSQVETFVEHLDGKVVNEQVYPHLQSGFVDQGLCDPIELLLNIADFMVFCRESRFCEVQLKCPLRSQSSVRKQ